MVTSSIAPTKESEFFIRLEVPDSPRNRTPKDRQGARIDRADEETVLFGPHMFSEAGILDPIG